MSLSSDGKSLLLEQALTPDILSYLNNLSLQQNQNTLHHDDAEHLQPPFRYSHDISVDKNMQTKRQSVLVPLLSPLFHDNETMSSSNYCSAIRCDTVLSARYKMNGTKIIIKCNICYSVNNC